MKRSTVNKLIAYGTALVVLIGANNFDKVIKEQKYSDYSDLKKIGQKKEEAILNVDSNFYNVNENQQIDCSYSQKFMYVPNKMVKKSIDKLNANYLGYYFKFQEIDNLDNYQEQLSKYGLEELDCVIYLVTVTSQNQLNLKIGNTTEDVDNWEQIGNIYKALDEIINKQRNYGSWYGISPIETNPQLNIEEKTKKLI